MEVEIGRAVWEAVIRNLLLQSVDSENERLLMETHRERRCGVQRKVYVSRRVKQVNTRGGAELSRKTHGREK